jgi:hypothetical protein
MVGNRPALGDVLAAMDIRSRVALERKHAETKRLKAVIGLLVRYQNVKRGDGVMHILPSR